MPVMMEKLYYALKAANVPDEQARAAAVEVAEYKESIAAIRTDLAVLKGMVAVNLAMTASLVVKVFVP
jgi:hypothetical protein